MSKLIPLLLLSLLCPGCGIVLFPVSIPLAIANNHSLQVHANVTDDDGKPIPQAKIISRTSVTFPSFHLTGLEAIYYITDDQDFRAVRQINNGRLDLASWGDRMRLQVQAPGKYPRTLEVTRQGVEELLPRDGRSDDGVETGSESEWVHVPLSRKELNQLALEPVGHPTKLKEYDRFRPSEATAGTLTYISLDDSGKHELDPRRQALPKNAIWLTAARDPDGAFARAGGWPHDPGIRAITLHSNFEGGGFIAIPLQNGRLPGGRIRIAPTTGYQSDWLVPHDGFASEGQRFFFYLKTDRLYGTGMLEYLWHWDPGTHMTADNDGGVSVELHLWLQPDGTTNVE